MDTTIELLQAAQREIQSLRRTNEILSAKVETMNLFATVLHTQPCHQGGEMSPNLVYAIELHVARLQKEVAKTDDQPVSGLAGIAAQSEGLGKYQL